MAWTPHLVNGAKDAADNGERPPAVPHFADDPAALWRRRPEIVRLQGHNTQSDITATTNRVEAECIETPQLSSMLGRARWRSTSRNGAMTVAEVLIASTSATSVHLNQVQRTEVATTHAKSYPLGPLLVGRKRTLSTLGPSMSTTSNLVSPWRKLSPRAGK